MLTPAGRKTWSKDRHTETAATAIVEYVPPVDGLSKLKVNALSYTQANVTTGSHALTFMGALSFTEVAVAAAAGAVTLTLKRDPGDYATAASQDSKPTPNVANANASSGHYYAVQNKDGSWQQSTVGTNQTLNANGTLTIDAGTVGTAGIGVGARFEFFGALTSTHPLTGNAHEKFIASANATLSLGNNSCPVVQTTIPGTGMIVSSNNTNAAGVLDWMNGWYEDEHDRG